ncbi:MAG: hypothetical protein JNK94_01395 [Hyphomonadaceae bacterium]|nr:hypothetical protein [Hyphomonadaceae bacterium]
MRIPALLGVVLALGACAPERTPQAPPTELARVEAPQTGARVTSPLRVSGVAPADWYFENQFSVTLVGGDGAIIAEAPAHPRVNWTAPGPKEFDAELRFDTEGPAVLVLQESMPRDGETPREVRMPVMLAR